MLAASRHPTLVILDARIPSPDGFAVCRQIQANAQLAGTIVIMVTADPRDETSATQAGADRYLSKPL
jgi:putative two-component system response regulator